jgi:hypothetical protein
MLRRVALVGIDVSDELSASIIMVTRIGELGTTLAVTSNRRTLVFLRSVPRLLVTASVVPSSPIVDTLMEEALSSSETSVVTRATLRNIRKDATLHSHRRENLKSYYGRPTSGGQVSACHALRLSQEVLTWEFRHHSTVSGIRLKGISGTHASLGTSDITDGLDLAECIQQARAGEVVHPMCCKLEGRGFETRCCE